MKKYIETAKGERGFGIKANVSGQERNNVASRHVGLTDTICKCKI
jgi:hypothetical protein